VSLLKPLVDACLSLACRLFSTTNYSPGSWRQGKLTVETGVPEGQLQLRVVADRWIKRSHTRVCVEGEAEAEARCQRMPPQQRRHGAGENCIGASRRQLLFLPHSGLEMFLLDCVARQGTSASFLNPCVSCSWSRKCRGLPLLPRYCDRLIGRWRLASVKHLIQPIRIDD
jgi:hypothetical protein